MIEKTSRRLRLAFILSANYSGSTLFSILLNRHPDMSSDGEPFTIWPKKICSCGKVQMVCDYYSTVCAHMRMEGSNEWNRHFFSNLPRYSHSSLLNTPLTIFLPWSAINHIRNAICKLPHFHSKKEAFIEAQQTFFQNSMNYRKAMLFVDGTKARHRAEIFATSKRFDMSIVHLIRDGRGFCNSYHKHQPRVSYSRAARIWNREIRKVDIIQKRLQDLPLLRVRYEDLCSNPKATLASVCDFLQVEYDETMIHPDVEVFHVMGNNMRLNFSGEVKEDLSWQKQLKYGEIKKIESIMRSGLERFGYLQH